MRRQATMSDFTAAKVRSPLAASAPMLCGSCAHSSLQKMLLPGQGLLSSRFANSHLRPDQCQAQLAAIVHLQLCGHE